MLFLFNFFPLIRSFYRSVFLPSCLSFIPIFYFNFSPSFALFPFHSFSPLIFPLSSSSIYLLPTLPLNRCSFSYTLSLLLFSCSLSLPLSLYRLYVYINSRIPRGKVRIWADLDPQHWDSNYTSYLCLHLPEARVGVWVEGVGVGSGSVRPVEK